MMSIIIRVALTNARRATRYANQVRHNTYATDQNVSLQVPGHLQTALGRQEVAKPPYAQLWLRYSAFIPLYPLGVASELTMAYLALPIIKAKQPLSVHLPNAFNFGFDYYTLCWLIIASYLPGPLSLQPVNYLSPLAPYKIEVKQFSLSSSVLTNVKHRNMSIGLAVTRAITESGIPDMNASSV